ncbi:MAG: flavin reductase [Pseudomonadota bacterium]|nr:flavin reductase [Pseudomonadota bacterium]
MTETASKKKSIKIRPFWYSDIWIFPKLINIITSMDKEGRINAAPYSFIMQYNVMHHNPQMMLGFRQDSHTFQNICDTGEFVINCPGWDSLEDMMETARFWPAGVNELEHTDYTMIPSQKVKPPSIAECPQIAECTVDEIVKLKKSNGIVVANIEAIVVDEGLEEMSRPERIKAMNLPIGLGDEKRQDYYYCDTSNVVMHRLKDNLRAYQSVDAKTAMDWDEESSAALMQVPPGVRALVINNTEESAKEKGLKTVTMKFFKELSAEYGMDDEVMDRFNSGG